MVATIKEPWYGFWIWADGSMKTVKEFCGHWRHCSKEEAISKGHISVICMLDCDEFYVRFPANVTSVALERLYELVKTMPHSVFFVEDMEYGVALFSRARDDRHKTEFMHWLWAYINARK